MSITELVVILASIAGGIFVLRLLAALIAVRMVVKALRDDFHPYRNRR